MRRGFLGQGGKGERATSSSPKKQRRTQRSSYHHHHPPSPPSLNIPPPITNRPKVMWVKTGHMSYKKKLLITTTSADSKCDTTATIETPTPQCHQPSPQKLLPSNGLSPASEKESQSNQNTSPQETTSSASPLILPQHSINTTTRDTSITPPYVTSSLSEEAGPSPGSRAVDCLMLLLDQPLKAAKLLKEVRPNVKDDDKIFLSKGRRREMTARTRLAEYMASFDDSPYPIDGHLSAIREETESEMGAESQTNRRMTPGVITSRPLLPLHECDDDDLDPQHPQATEAVIETLWEALSAPEGLSPAPSMNSDVSIETDDMCPEFAPLVEMSLSDDAFLGALLADDGSTPAVDGTRTYPVDPRGGSNENNSIASPVPSIGRSPMSDTKIGSQIQPQANTRSSKGEKGKSATKQYWNGFGAFKSALFTPRSAANRRTQSRPTSSSASASTSHTEVSPSLFPSAPLSAPLMAPSTSLLHSSHPQHITSIETL